MHQHRAESADAAVEWIDDALRQRGRDGRIQGIAARPQNFSTYLDGERLRRDDDPAVFTLQGNYRPRAIYAVRFVRRGKASR